MYKSILITGGRVIDPKKRIDEIKDIFIIDNRIVENKSEVSMKDSVTINPKECLVLPELIDFHIHFHLSYFHM